MKKLLSLFAVFTALAVFVSPALAVKPASNNAGAQEVDWNLSGAVMPVPPYGSVDIPGSDTASKLVFNQPNGKVKAMVTGVMGGLLPNTEYTVYLSSAYTPAVFTGWNTTGNYLVNVEYLGIDYPETLILAQTGTNITGTSLDTVPPGSLFTITGGSVTGNTIDIVANNGPLVINMTGTIAPDGSISGTWADELPGTRVGTWSTTSGYATKTYSGSTGFPGLLSGVSPFTFTTDSDGLASWHYNFKDTAPATLSVWVNEAGGTLLISDSVTLL